MAIQPDPVTPMSETTPRPFPRRSLLFTPGDSRRKIEKGAGLAVDGLILDLEDGVALNRKAEARAVVGAALAEIDFGRIERLVRVNGLATEWFAADLAAAAAAGPDAIVVPKVDSAADLARVDAALAALEAKNGRPPGGIRLLVLIETPLGVLNLPEIARCGGRLDGLILGGEDLAAGLGATRTPEGWELFYARSALVTAAAAYGLSAIDNISVDLDRHDRLAEEARQGRRLGFTGKMAIHPAQVPVINDCFSPTPAEIETARRLIAAYEAHQQAGAGAFAFKGRMVDRPIILAAQNTLHRAQLTAPYEE